MHIMGTGGNQKSCSFGAVALFYYTG